jgi:dCMP deaminase
LTTSSSERPGWDETWMAFAESIALRSKCCRAQVGCVIVSSDQEVIGAGYNGPSPNYPADGSCALWCPRGRGEGGTDNTYDNCPSVHAEANCVVRCDYSRIHGATVYTTRSTCFQCAKLLSAAGVVRVVHRVLDSDAHRDPESVEQFLSTCGIEVTRWTT